nr:hypothetical protein JVH1_4365 [Rhodococcus sp. JVH1]
MLGGRAERYAHFMPQVLGEPRHEGRGLGVTYGPRYPQSALVSAALS